jgi:hypothetical protein
MRGFWAIALMVGLTGWCAAPAAAPAVDPVWPKQHPGIACTAEELARLQAAYRGTGPAHAVVVKLVKAGEAALQPPVVYPPRGGQHNQWYQCDKCQVALITIDDTHHQCRKCKQIYSGEPYDDVIFSRLHGKILGRMHAAAWAYAITGNAKFASFAREVLLGYADRYRQYPYHSNSRNPASRSSAGGHLFEQTLTEASSLATHIAPAYDLICDAPVMTQKDRERIRDGLLIPMLQNLDKNKAGMGNWQTWHNAAMLWGGAVLHDDAWIKKAITDPKNGFFYQMQASVTDDGLWYENSWGYHFYTLSAMVEIAEGARRLGIDLWSHPRFKTMFTLPARYAMPDGSLPRFGDDVNTRMATAGSYLEFAFHAYGDKAMRPYLCSQPTQQTIMFGRDTAQADPAPELASDVFLDAGHAILRSSGDKRLATVMTFGPYGGFHGHFDKLSFVFFGLDTELGVDPGRAASQAYRLPIHQNWYKATLSHNTVLVNGQSQKGTSGKLLLFKANQAAAAVLATVDAADPGTHHRRLLVQTPDYLLVFDQLEANQESRFDWLYHNRGNEASSSAATAATSLKNAFSGAEYIGNPRQAMTDAPLEIQFKNNGVTTHLMMAAAPGTRLLLGDAPGASVDDRVSMAMISRRGTQVHFAAVLEPVRNTPPTVTQVLSSVRDGLIHLEIHQGKSIDTITLDRQNQMQLQRNGKVVLKND